MMDPLVLLDLAVKLAHQGHLDLLDQLDQQGQMVNVESLVQEDLLEHQEPLEVKEKQDPPVQLDPQVQEEKLGLKVHLVVVVPPGQLDQVVLLGQVDQEVLLVLEEKLDQGEMMVNQGLQDPPDLEENQVPLVLEEKQVHLGLQDLQDPVVKVGQEVKTELLGQLDPLDQEVINSVITLVL